MANKRHDYSQTPCSLSRVTNSNLLWSAHNLNVGIALFNNPVGAPIVVVHNYHIPITSSGVILEPQFPQVHIKAISFVWLLLATQFNLSRQEIWTKTTKIVNLLIAKWEVKKIDFGEKKNKGKAYSITTQKSKVWYFRWQKSKGYRMLRCRILITIDFSQPCNNDPETEG